MLFAMMEKPIKIKLNMNKKMARSVDARLNVHHRAATKKKKTQTKKKKKQKKKKQKQSQAGHNA